MIKQYSCTYINVIPNHVSNMISDDDNKDISEGLPGKTSRVGGNVSASCCSSCSGFS